MSERLIKEIQKFLNAPFRYADLIKFLDKKKNFLLHKNIIDKTNEREYNALWDTINDLERLFLFGNKPQLVIGTKVSVLKIFNYNLSERTKNNSIFKQ